MNKLFKRVLVVGSLVIAATPAFAVAPLDLAATGTEIAGYVGMAATAGIAVAAAIWGVRIIVKAFKAVAK